MYILQQKKRRKKEKNYRSRNKKKTLLKDCKYNITAEIRLCRLALLFLLKQGALTRFARGIYASRLLRKPSTGFSSPSFFVVSFLARRKGKRRRRRRQQCAVSGIRKRWEVSAGRNWIIPGSLQQEKDAAQGARPGHGLELRSKARLRAGKL